MKVFDLCKYYFSQMNQNVKASSFFLFANVIQKFVMILMTPLFTRVMSADEFSKYAIFQSWEAIFTVFATLNISSYASAKAFVEKDIDNIDYIFNSMLFTVFLTIIIFFIYLFVKISFSMLNSLPLHIMILLFGDIIFVSFFNFWSQYERYCQRYKSLVLVSLFIGVLSPILSLVLIVFSCELSLYKGWARIIAAVFINGLASIFIVYAFVSQKRKFHFNFFYIKNSVGFSLPLIPHFLSAAFLQKASQLFVDKYDSAIHSGVFSLGVSIAMMMMVFNDALTKTIVPWTFKKLDVKEFYSINQPIVACLLLIAFLNILMCLIAPDVVFIFASKEYYNAVYVIPPLVGVCFFAFLYNSFSNIVYFFKETAYVSYASVISGIFLIFFEWIFVPKYGYVAASYCTLASFVLYALLHFLFMTVTLKRHLCNFKIFKGILIFKISLFVVLALIFVPFTYSYSIYRYLLLFCFLLSIFIYLNKNVNTYIKLLNGH